MHVLYSLGDLFDDGGCLFLWDFSLFFKLLVEGSSLHVFQDDEKMGFVIEETVHGQDIFVVKTALQSDFHRELVDHLFVFYDCLGYFLQGEHPHSFFVKGNVDSPVFTLSKFFANSKLLDSCLDAGRRFSLCRDICNLFGNGIKSEATGKTYSQ